ncbi:MAG TPA: TraR/DksA C4-type zinc finger protein [Flexivirga sp.]|uniref:TraR/DksA family transcriptional regulator n=1 Tax=Flexivirga sp. TaxID=1962927 RepID=UPI002BF90615|nr:TraR/DksA C4-type zinc finger protein [Flexivirga sp.]HWC22479.1 TraR/DksA C4-type zinc finger protein [Flexivirga sp.]
MEPDAARAMLVAKRAEALERLRGLDASFTDIVEAAQDSNLDDEHDPEGTTVAVSRAQVSSLAAETRLHLNAIDEALARVESGSYGICSQCGEAIAAARLEALPATTTCISCAQSAHRARN